MVQQVPLVDTDPVRDRAFILKVAALPANRVLAVLVWLVLRDRSNRDQLIDYLRGL